MPLIASVASVGALAAAPAAHAQLPVEPRLPSFALPAALSTNIGAAGQVNDIAVARANFEDGRAIVVAGTASGRLVITDRQGGASSHTTLPSAIVGVTTGDFGHGGHVNIAVALQGSGQVRVYSWSPQNGTVLEDTQSVVSPSDVKAGDFDGDGRDDLAVATPSGVSILNQTSPGTLELNGVSFPGGASKLAVGQINGTGGDDLAVTGRTSPFSGLYLLTRVTQGRDTRVVSSSTTGSNTAPYAAVAVGRVDVDHARDSILTASAAGFVTAQVPNGPGAGDVVARQIGRTGTVGAHSLAVADVNGDGHPDVVAGETVDNQVSLFVRRASGYEVRTTLLDDPGTDSDRTRIAVADVDGDFVPDLVGFQQVPNHLVWARNTTDAVAPTITLRSPSDGDTFTQGQSVAARYTCADDDQIASCKGTVAPNQPIDTGELGQKRFTVRAVDRSRNVTERTVTYTVVAADGTPPTPGPQPAPSPAPSPLPGGSPTPTPPAGEQPGPTSRPTIRLATPKVARSGRSFSMPVRLRGMGRGTVRVIATHDGPKGREAGAERKRLVYARSKASTVSGDRQVTATVRQTAAGRKARYSRSTKTIRLRVTTIFRPQGGGREVRRVTHVRVPVRRR